MCKLFSCVLSQPQGEQTSDPQTFINNVHSNIWRYGNTARLYLQTELC